LNCKFNDVRSGIANAAQPGELGKLIGVQKARISRLENNASNVTLDTLLRVFTALKAKVKLQVELSDLNLSVGGKFNDAKYTT
jgi:transcriptional regulator with XRE-family HTH domain